MSAIYSSAVLRKSFQTTLGGLRSWFTQSLKSQTGFSFTLHMLQGFRSNSFHATDESIMIVFAVLDHQTTTSSQSPGLRIFLRSAKRERLSGNRNNTIPNRFLYTWKVLPCYLSPPCYFSHRIVNRKQESSITRWKQLFRHSLQLVSPSPHGKAFTSIFRREIKISNESFSKRVCLEWTRQ